jgi:hypothetical protein
MIDNAPKSKNLKFVDSGIQNATPKLFPHLFPVTSIRFWRTRCSAKNAISNMMTVESTVEIAEPLFRPTKISPLEMQVILLWWKGEE